MSNAITKQGAAYELTLKLRSELLKWDGVFDSMVKQTWIVGEIINQMSNHGLTYTRIADILKESPKFRTYTDKSLKELASRWGQSVHHLKIDYGDTFEEAQAKIKELHSSEVTMQMLRDYRGDMALCVQKPSGKSEKTFRKKMKEMDSMEKAQFIAGLVEDFAQGSIQDTDIELDEHQQQAVDRIKKVKMDLATRWREVSTEYIRTKQVPSIRSGVYQKFLVALSCVHCEKAQCGSAMKFKTDMPISDGDSDIIAVPMCKKCQDKYRKDEISFSDSDKKTLSIKYFSMFFQAVLMDT